MFSNEHDGRYPELSAEPGQLVMLNKAKWHADPILYEHMTDPSVLFCPSADVDKKLCSGTPPLDGQTLLDRSSYAYLGYAVDSDEQLELFAEAYRERIAQGLPFDKDLTISQDGKEVIIHRLTEGVERFLITDLNNPAAVASEQARIPLFIEHLGNHRRSDGAKGADVVFTDGHVTFVEYPGPWPMTERAVSILQSLESMQADGPRRPR